MKRCKHCGERKPFAEFYAHSAARDGRRPECKACTSARRKRWYAENRQREIDRVRRWARENPERYKVRQDEYRESGRKRVADRKSHLKRTFGLSEADYERILASQDGGCAICGRLPGSRNLHVDHDHATGAVRGLLCFACNVAIGHLRDDPML
ncbi:MAG: endonuclease VII domain-containing protein, partial [Acidimicrobiia bacterium]|nr:endonuclease VII domain-containing protein [Acidimicrobiia bacterium]